MKQGVKHTIKTTNAYFLTLTVVNWIDVFTRKNHRDTIIEALKYCQKEKGLILFAYVIMSNHIHMIANTNEPFQLKDTIRDFKKYTAKKIILQIESKPESRREWMLGLFAYEAKSSKKHKFYRFWQEGNHAIELCNEKFVWDKINYIHYNPVKAGFVAKTQHWTYSSASNYQDKESIIDVTTVPQRLMTY
jgi:putative transposase